MSKEKDFSFYKEIWYELYMNFNDDNLRHCENSFHNKGFETVEELKKGCINFIKEIQSHKVTLTEIILVVPNCKELMEV